MLPNIRLNVRCYFSEDISMVIWGIYPWTEKLQIYKQLLYHFSYGKWDSMMTSLHALFLCYQLLEGHDALMESRSLTMLLPNYNKTQKSEELSWCQAVQTSWLEWNCVSLFLNGCDLSLALLRSLKFLAHLWGDDQIPSF